MKNGLKPKTTLSKSAHIVLRKRKISGGRHSLFLDKHTSGQGKRNYEFLGLYLTGDKEKDKETLILAEEIRSKHVLEVRAINHGEIDRKKADGNFVDYFQKLSEGPKKGIKHWRLTLNHLKAYTEGSIKFKHISAEWLDGFKQYLLEQVSKNTASTYYDSIRAALRLAARDRIIIHNPVEITDGITKKQSIRVHLSLEEIIKLDKTECKYSEVKIAFLFSCFSGLRLSDVKNLHRSQVKAGKIIFTQEKTKEAEYIDLTEQALVYLALAKGREDGLVFDLPKSEWTINEQLKAWAKKAEIKKNIHFHVARHTFAVLAIDYEIDIYTLSKLLGHKELKTTLIYAKITDKRKKEAVKKMPVLGRTGI